MGTNREKTEIISHRAQLAVTHLPPIVMLSDTVLDRYNKLELYIHKSMHELCRVFMYIQQSDLV